MNNKFSSLQIHVLVKSSVARELIVKRLDKEPIDLLFLISRTNTYLTDMYKLNMPINPTIYRNKIVVLVTYLTLLINTKD